MRMRPLREFFEAEIEDAKKKGVLLSLHLKATMMKISDPIMFGHAVSVFFKDVLKSTPPRCKRSALNPNNGLGDLYAKLVEAAGSRARRHRSRHQSRLREAPGPRDGELGQGRTNLHVPSDVIVDASIIPAMIRNSGKMWGKDGKLHDIKALIPDRAYARVYEAVIEDCKKHGAFDPKTMGTVPNVGLMAQSGGGVRLPRQNLRDLRRKARFASSTRRASFCSNRMSSWATSSWRRMSASW